MVKVGFQLPGNKRHTSNPTHVILYLTHLAEKAGSFASIGQYHSALSWVHNLQGLDSPVRDPVIIEVVNGIKRQLACPTIRKEPFSTDNIKSLFKVMKTSSLTDVRNTTLIVLAFVAFLRFDEVINIHVNDVSFKESHLEIAITKAKTDQLRQDKSIVIASTGGNTCPVWLLSFYTKSAGFKKSKQNNGFLFTRVILKIRSCKSSTQERLCHI